MEIKQFTLPLHNVTLSASPWSHLGQTVKLSAHSCDLCCLSSTHQGCILKTFPQQRLDGLCILPLPLLEFSLGHPTRSIWPICCCCQLSSSNASPATRAECVDECTLDLLSGGLKEPVGCWKRPTQPGRPWWCSRLRASAAEGAQLDTHHSKLPSCWSITHTHCITECTRIEKINKEKHSRVLIAPFSLEKKKVALNPRSQLPIIPIIRYHPQASLLQGIRWWMCARQVTDLAITLYDCGVLEHLAMRMNTTGL